MPESLPAVVMDETPEILWHGVDTVDQIRVIQGGASLGPGLTWVQNRLSREGVHTRIFLNYVPDSQPFEIAVMLPEKRSVQVSLTDRDVELLASAGVEAGAEQGILRFSKAQGRTGWLVSSYSATLRPDEPGQSLTKEEERLLAIPQEYRRDAESLLQAIPVLQDGIDEVRLVVDISASMKPWMSSGLEQFASLGWTLAYAAGDAAKTAVLVGDMASRSAIDASMDASAWAESVRSGLTAGMPTGKPMECESTMAQVPSRVAALCLTDAMLVNIDEVANRRSSGWSGVVVAEVEAARMPTPSGLGPRESFALVEWDGSDRLVSALLAVYRKEAA